MIELIAAAAGGIIAIAGQGALNRLGRSDEARDAVIRLTSAVEHIATQLEALHNDMKEDRKEIYGRLGGIELRVTKLEVHPHQ
jgi:outer membrane murein-binding lipoprotein Lpp